MAVRVDSEPFRGASRIKVMAKLHSAGQLQWVVTGEYVEDIGLQKVPAVGTGLESGWVPSFLF